MKQRGPPLKDIVLRIVGSLILLFVIAQISRITGIHLIQLVFSFVILVLSLELMFKPTKVKRLLYKTVERIINEKVQSLVEEKGKDKLNRN